MACTAEEQGYRCPGAHHRPCGRPFNRNTPIDQQRRWLEAGLAHHNQLGLSEPLKLVLGITDRAAIASRVTIRHNQPLITYWAILASLVTIVHNWAPIDSPVLRSTMRGMRIAYLIRNTDQSGRNDHHCLSDKECLWFCRERSESLI